MNRIKKVITIPTDADGQSDAIDLGRTRLAAIDMPSGWTAAAITLLAASSEGGTYKDVKDDGGTEVSITVAASEFVVLAKDVAEDLGTLRYIKLRSGTSASPVQQGAERTLTLWLEGCD